MRFVDNYLKETDKEFIPCQLKYRSLISTSSGLKSPNGTHIACVALKVGVRASAVEGDADCE